LSEPRHDEVDPYYAHCKSHSDKTQIKNRKKNYNALIVQIKHHEAERLERKTCEKQHERIERKLKKHRIKYTSNKLMRPEPWGELEEFLENDDKSQSNFCYFFCSSYAKND
jgi:hypothetical protein